MRNIATHPYDFFRGIVRRRVNITVTVSGLVCDLCNKELPKESKAVCETNHSPENPIGQWENEFGTIL
jgi:hypothetical protein